jgi:hypothetical protein
MRVAMDGQVLLRIESVLQLDLSKVNFNDRQFSSGLDSAIFQIVKVVPLKGISAIATGNRWFRPKVF